jgi:small subunit ribosomal protein S16
LNALTIRNSTIDLLNNFTLMLKIRLSRVGRKHVAKYRVVLTEHRQSAKHGFIKILGSYDPHTKTLIMDQAEADKYIATGAQYSDTLAKIIAKNK